MAVSSKYDVARMQKNRYLQRAAFESLLEVKAHILHFQYAQVCYQKCGSSRLDSEVTTFIILMRSRATVFIYLLSEIGVCKTFTKAQTSLRSAVIKYSIMDALDGVLAMGCTK